mmetsp:Transcript_13629/g.30120  ORF Transcript_13629/g.30120 Transcript_13629/m.30120 type:complete len:230 (-) Transcript_13629:227-916(-)
MQQDAWCLLRNILGKSRNARITLQCFSAHELLHRTLPSLEFSNDLAHDGKHRNAPVVNLLRSHLGSKLLPLEWITEASRVLRWLPSDSLVTGNQEHDQGEAFKALVGAQGCQASWHILKAGKLHIVCEKGSCGCHHGKAAVLNLRSSQMLEASRIAREGHQTTLAKPQRIKEVQGAGDTRLLFKHKRWFWGIKAEATLIILCENTCPCNLLRAASSCTKCNDACSRSSG